MHASRSPVRLKNVAADAKVSKCTASLILNGNCNHFLKSARIRVLESASRRSYVSAWIFALLILSFTPAWAEEFTAATTAKWFGMGTTLRVLGSNGTEQAVQRVVGMDGHVRGWMFRTDRIPPVIKGIRNRSEIGVLVGLGSDGRITAVEVLDHHEDQAWFHKLKAPFYRQFEKLPADGSGKTVDAVTGATVSSKALINDVLSACETVLALTNVQAVVRSAATHTP